MAKPMAKSVYVISVAAELAGVHPQTLRIYERKGLLEPERTAGNTRRYSEADIARLLRIQELTQEHGVNLAGVRMIMELEERVAQLQAELARWGQLVEEIQARAQEAIESVHRSYRRDLVPVSRDLVPLSGSRRRR
jgi:MerR family transcriptional regulator, heat shock protein HspR